MVPCRFGTPTRRPDPRAGDPVIKKIALAAACLIAIALGWKFVLAPVPEALEDLRPDAAGSSPTALAPVDDPGLTQEPERTEAQVEAPQAVAPVAVTGELPTSGALDVHVVWESGGGAAGEHLRAWSVGTGSKTDRSEQCDGQGRVHLADLQPGTWRVNSLRGGGDEPSSWEEVEVVAGETALLTLVNEDGVTVDGKVVDSRGGVVGGAEIWLSRYPSSGLAYPMATADAAGRFTLRGVGPKNFLGARAKGFAPSYQRGVRGAPGASVQVELVLEGEGSSVRGRVVDERGAGIAGANWILGAGLSQGRFLSSGIHLPAPAQERGVTDADGGFTPGSFAPGWHPLQVVAEGFGVHAAMVDLAPGAAEPLEVVLLPEARVVGRVLDSAGEPVAGARIGGRGSPDFRLNVRSAADGTFALGRLAGGEQQIFARHEERGRALIELVLVPGEETRWDAVLGERDPAQSRIHGRVVDADGEPVSGLRVAISRGAGMLSSGTGPEGAFSLRAEPELLYVLVVQSGADFSFPALLLRDVMASPDPLLLRLLPEGEDPDRGRIEVTVLTSDGEPAADVTLHVWHASEVLSGRFTPDSATGRIVAEAVPMGTVTLRVVGMDHPAVEIGEREIVGGRTLDLGEIRLTEGGRARGAIHSWAGFRGERFYIFAQPTNGGRGQRAEAGPASYRTLPLLPGDYELRVQGDHVITASFSFTARKDSVTDMDITIERAGLREAHFTPHDPDQPQFLAVRLQDAAGEMVWRGNASMYTDGGPLRARISARPGSYQLTANSGDGWAAAGDFEIPSVEGEEPAVVFALIVVEGG